MSNKYNDQWLEDAQSNFEAAVIEENWDMARAIIADLRENGFSKEAITLEVELVQVQNDDHER